MGIQDIPRTKVQFDEFIRRYESRHFVYSEASARVTEATVRIVQGWLPAFLRPAVRPVVCSLMPDHFLDAVGYPRPPAWRRRAVEEVLRGVGLFHRFFALCNYPGETTRRRQRTYPSGYTIEALEPVNLTERAHRRRARDRRATARAVAR